MLCACFRLSVLGLCFVVVPENLDNCYYLFVLHMGTKEPRSQGATEPNHQKYMDHRKSKRALAVFFSFLLSALLVRGAWTSSYITIPSNPSSLAVVQAPCVGRALPQMDVHACISSMTRSNRNSNRKLKKYNQVSTKWCALLVGQRVGSKDWCTILGNVSRQKI